MNELNFIPSEREILLEHNKNIVCKFSKDLLLEYINEYFTKFSDYQIHDMIGLSFDEMKHPSIPQCISNIIKQHLEKKENINLVLKDEVKDGRYYWFITDFKFTLDKEKTLKSFTYYRNPPPRTAIAPLEELYKRLLDIEKYSSIEAAEKYLDGLLEEKKMSFLDYTKYLSQGEEFIEVKQQSRRMKKKSLMKKIFGK